MSPHSTQILQQIAQLSETEQLELIQHLIQQHLPQNTTNKENSIIGCFKDDPQFEDFLAAIAEYRRQVDTEDPWLSGTMSNSQHSDLNYNVEEASSELAHEQRRTSPRISA